MIYRPATKEDTPGLIRLWQEAFGETPILPPCESYVAQEDGQIVGMLFAMEQKLKLKKTYRAAYLYAIATQQARRGQGICRGLMAYAEGALSCDCCILVPASEALFGFYETMGYETSFYKTKAQAVPTEEISMEEYLHLREQLLSGVPHVVYEDLSYAQRIYGLRFGRTEDGICAASEQFTAEALPRDLGGRPCGMIKWMREKEPFERGYLGFTLE